MINRHSNTGRLRVLAILATLAYGTSSCVLPNEDQAAPVENIPPGLFTTTTAVADEPELPAEDVSYQLNLYWHNGVNHLVLVSRQRETPPTIEEVLNGLTQGPTESEKLESAEPPIGSNVQASLQPTAVLEENGVLVVTVSDDFKFREFRDDKILITEELVCSLTRLSNVSAVRIDDSQGQISLADSEAQGIDGPASASDFGNCEVEVFPPEFPEGEDPDAQEDPDANE